MDKPIVPQITCTKCKVVYPATIEFFSRDKLKVNGLRSHCRKCSNAMSNNYKRRNPEKTKATYKRWIKNNPERVKELKRRDYQRNRTQYDLRNHERRMLERNLPCDFSKEQWEDCLNYFHGCCAYCGKQRDFWNVLEKEHFIPLNSPNCTGTIPKNMLPACVSCNGSKQDTDAIEWLKSRFGKRKAKAILKRIQDYFDSL